MEFSCDLVTLLQKRKHDAPRTCPLSARAPSRRLLFPFVFIIQQGGHFRTECLKTVVNIYFTPLYMLTRVFLCYTRHWVRRIKLRWMVPYCIGSLLWQLAIKWSSGPAPLPLSFHMAWTCLCTTWWLLPKISIPWGKYEQELSCLWWPSLEVTGPHLLLCHLSTSPCSYKELSRFRVKWL